jgi:tRNA threonylcarbamoyladenosine biosynthesis protein TsaE
LLGQNLQGGEVLELRADLGGGKTTFVHGLAAGLKSSDRVSSPTFTLSRVYKAGDLSIHHYDFYRLDEPGVLADQLAESVGDPQAITVVEWADVADNVLPEQRLIIEFKPTASSADERQITITYPDKYVDLVGKLETDWQGSRP